MKIIYVDHNTLNRLASYKSFIDYINEEENSERSEFIEKNIELINKIIKKHFTKRQKMIFLMYYKYNLKQSHIANILKITQAGVNMCLKRCLNKIRKILKENKNE